MTDILVVAEHRDGAIRDITAEMISAAADSADGAVDVLLIADDPDALIGAVSLEPVETIHTFAHAEPFNHDVYQQVVSALAKDIEPALIIGPNTANGLDYLPAVATSLDWPLVTDVVELSRDGDELSIVRDRYGSKVEATMAVPTLPAMVSIRAAEWEPAENSGSPEVAAFDYSLDEEAITSHVRALEAVSGGEVDITDADVLISVGRGIEDEDNLGLIEELADALGATIAASRPIVDAGWLPKDRQVGQSGKTVSPDVYIAIGISGAVQHIAGIKGAKTIVVINKDPDAPIFDVADVGIVDDLFDVVPALIEALST